MPTGIKTKSEEKEKQNCVLYSVQIRKEKL